MRNLTAAFVVSRASKHQCVCWALLFLSCCNGASLAQQDNLALTELQQQELSIDDINQKYQRRLAEPGISDYSAVEIAVAWLREVTQQAIEARPSEQIIHWKQIRKIVTSSEHLQDSPREILIRIQFAISELTHAALVRQQGSTLATAEKNLGEARLILRSVVSELQAIEEESEKLLLDTYKKSASAARASGWTKTELESLRRNIALHQSRAYRNQALCYPAGSPDYLNSLILALKSVADLSRSSLNENSIWSARLEHLACLRLLKRFSEARQLLEQWSHNELAPAIASKFEQEAARLDLAEGRIESMPGEKVDPLMRTAAKLFAEGKHQEAMEAYDRAAEKFSDEGNSRQRFEAAQTAAAIARALDDQRSASRRFRRLALDQPEHVEAATSHFVALGLAASLSREAENTGQSDSLEFYVLLLEEHLRLWPHGNQSATVRLWLGHYWMSQQQWSSALEVLTKVDLADERAEECAAAAADCFLRELQRLENASTEEAARKNDLIAEAKNFLLPTLVGSDGDWTEEWNDASRLVALQLSEMHLRYLPEGHRYARKLLSRSLASSPDGDKAWKLLASALLGEAQIRSGKMKQALRVVEAAQRIDQGNDGDITLTLDLLKAKALAALGKRDQALSIYQKLLDSHEESGEIHEAYGLLLSQSEEAEDLRLALQTWRQIEKQSKPAGPRWLRARQARLELLNRLGKGEHAEKLLQLTKLIYPQVADSLEAKLPSQSP